MKIWILTIALLCSGACVRAQKGDLWLGGSLGFSAENIRSADGWDNEIRTLNLNPYLEYYFTDNWSLLFGPGVRYHQQSRQDNPRGWQAGPFLGVLRYFSLTDRLSFFAGIGCEAYWGSSKDDYHRYSSSEYSIYLMPGLDYSLSDRLSLYLSLGDWLGYESFRKKDKDNPSGKERYSRFSAEFLGEGLTLGVVFRLGK